MNPPIPLACRCGALQGRLLPSALRSHLRCYCDDCQTAAFALGRPDTLDAHGGSAILQTVPAAVALSPGPLALLRLSPKGLLRWHCGACQTPVANTLGNPRLPFVGLALSFIAVEPAEREARFGPSVGIQGRFARGGKPAQTHDKAPFSTLWATGGILLRGALTGAHQPSPFFSGGEPVVAARILTKDERTAAAQAARGG